MCMWDEDEEGEGKLIVEWVLPFPSLIDGPHLSPLIGGPRSLCCPLSLSLCLAVVFELLESYFFLRIENLC